MEERRRNKRLALAGKLSVKRLDEMEEKDFAIEVMDVSRTGIGFLCEEPLKIGNVYATSLTLWTKDVINAFIEIVRIEELDDVLLYGGIFIGMPDVDLQRITVYETMQEFEEKRNKENLT